MKSNFQVYIENGIDGNFIKKSLIQNVIFFNIQRNIRTEHNEYKKKYKKRILHKMETLKSNFLINNSSQTLEYNKLNYRVAE